MICKFQKIPVELPKALSHKGNLQWLLHAILGDWYINKLNEKLPLLNKQDIRKHIQKSRME